MPDDPHLSDWELPPAAVKAMLDRDEAVLLLDCRTPKEWEIARIEGATLMPMQDIPGRVVELEDLAQGREVVVMCHHGQRSMQVVGWLRGQGFDEAKSMAGGIERWSLEVDAGVSRY